MDPKTSRFTRRQAEEEDQEEDGIEEPAQAMPQLLGSLFIAWHSLFDHFLDQNGGEIDVSTLHVELLGPKSLLSLLSLSKPRRSAAGAHVLSNLSVKPPCGPRFHVRLALRSSQEGSDGEQSAGGWAGRTWCSGLPGGAGSGACQACEAVEGHQMLALWARKAKAAPKKRPSAVDVHLAPRIS